MTSVSPATAPTLTVTYTTIEGCVLIETHLRVGDDEDGIPQTRKGNPIPGRFEHSDPYGPTDTYVYTLEAGRAARSPHRRWCSGGRDRVGVGCRSRFVERGNWAMYFTYPAS